MARQAWREGGSYYWYLAMAHTERDFEAIRDHPAYRELVRVRG